MNRALMTAIAVAMLSSGCVARVSGPRAVIVAEPVPPPVVIAPQPVYVAPPPPPVVVVPQPVVIHPPVLVSPPRIVIVPGTQVYTVPTASYNVFVYGGQYYSFHHGTWFHAPRHGAAWTAVGIHAVPAPVRAVPAKHWKIPPGQEKHGGYDRPDERRVGDRQDDKRDGDKRVIIIDKREDKTVIIDKRDDKRVIVDKPGDKRVIIEKKDDKRVIVDKQDDKRVADKQDDKRDKQADRDDKDKDCPPGQSKKGKC